MSNHSKMKGALCRPFFSLGECPRGIDNCNRSHHLRKCSCGLVLSAKYIEAHTKGVRHRTLYEALQVSEQAAGPGETVNGAASDPEEAPGKQKCDKCGKIVLMTWWTSHLEFHSRRDRRSRYEEAMQQAETDKEGVIVTGKDGIDFGVLGEESSVEVTVTIENTTSEYSFSLKTCRMLSSERRDAHGKMFSVRMQGKSKAIRAKTSKMVAIKFHPGYAGRYEDTLELVFWHLDLHRTFFVTRKVAATVGDREDHEQLRASSMYTGPRDVPRFRPDGSAIIPSTRPPTWTKTLWTDKLPEYKVPQSIIDAAFDPKSMNNARNNVKQLLPAALNMSTYMTWWQVLLFLEEEQTRRDLDMYALEDVEITATYPRYELQVPGLAENRPSVLVGDFILVSEANSAIPLEKRQWYEGRVHAVRMKSVILVLGDGFHTFRRNKFDVRFVLNRLPFRRMHHAIVNDFKPQRILFPMPGDLAWLKKPTEAQKAALVPHYRQLKEDEEQLETITAILHQRPGTVPFIVFGPPGTGKTVTIIEAINQLLDKDPSIKILACAPSNSAADLLAQKLTNRGSEVVFRLNSLTRKLLDLPKTLLKFSRVNENEVFAIPPIEELAKFRVVVATCLSGGVPASLGVKRGHFSHIFVDEAGQAKEPEVMFPIKSLAGPKTNIILAGDNQQLGPIVHSPLAGQLGLKTSFLARLMDREVYNLDGGNRGLTIVKLVKNFRSHPEILQFSNEQFYNSELRPCGDVAMIRSLEMIEELPKKRFPLVFHGIVGRDQREASSPSFFNADEASQVKKYCHSLLENKKYRLTAEHIGIITPYHAQRCKILDLLHKDVKTRDIKVGSVEEFQGQERRIIIMSTVRSNTEFISSDITRSLGFVANSRRMNVAITRAQALLIVIGNPIVLSLDPLWRNFLSFIHTRGGWRGKEIDWNPDERDGGDELAGSAFETRRRTQAEQEMEETIQRLKALIVQRHEDSDVEIDLDDGDDEGGESEGAFERPILREAE